jgi:hypothetical protein
MGTAQCGVAVFGGQDAGRRMMRFHISTKRKSGNQSCPSLVLFDIALSPSPRRGQNKSAQGNALGFESRQHVTSPVRAKQYAKFVEVSSPFVLPFQGEESSGFRDLGRRCALPQADIFWPLRGGETGIYEIPQARIAQHQNSRFGLVSITANCTTTDDWFSLSGALGPTAAPHRRPESFLPGPGRSRRRPRAGRSIH